MLPNILNTILRIAGLLITIILLVQPWLISGLSADPFLNSGWAQIISAIISLTFSSVLLALYRPKNGYVTLNAGLLILFIAISIALYNSPYNIAIRASLLAVGSIANLGSLRLLRKQQDNFSIGGMISLCGFFMAIYAICQATGHDFLIWDSKFNVVGTLANPNFLAIFLCLTSAVSFGMFAEIYSNNKKHGLVFLAFFLLQIAVIISLGRTGAFICLLFMVILWIWARWFKISGKISRKTPIIAGLILATILFAIHYSIYQKTSSYDWSQITKVPEKARTAVSRFVLWQMGFEIFRSHFKTGAGVGSVAYIMPLKRPPTGSTLGINIYNDDPHSIIVTTLAETGFLGLLGLCILLATVYGCYIRKNTKYESVEELKDNSEKVIVFPWLYTSVAVLILYLSFQSGFIKSYYLPIAISAVIAFFGILTSYYNRNYESSSNDYRYLGRSTLVAIFTFIFYSLFNNTFSILPLIAFLVMLTGFHFSCCQPDVQWKPRMTFVSLLFLFLPIIYGTVACHIQSHYQQEQYNFEKGATALNEGNWSDAENYFKQTIKENSQQLKAYYGLGIALEEQQKLDEAQETFMKLDAMVPNIFNTKYEIAKILFNSNKLLEAHRIAVRNLKYAENPLSYELLGEILLAEGRLGEAENIMKEGLINNLPLANERQAADRMRLKLAAIASNRGDYKSCRTYIDAIKTEVAENIDTMYLKGMLLTNEKKFDKALAIYEKILETYPHVPRILNAVGYLLLETNKNLERAQILLEEAYQLTLSNEQPNLSDTLMIANSLGKLYLKQNKLRQAGELLKYSYEHTPSEWKELKEKRLQDLNDFYNSFSEAQ